MTYRGTFVASLLGIAVSALACSASEQPKEDVSNEISALSQLTGSTRNVGTLENGKTKSVTYSSTPKYRSVTIVANPGDKIDSRISSTDGDAVAWLTDWNRNVLAFNDDESSTSYDARLTYTVPAAAEAGAKYLVFLREYDLEPAKFSVTLSLTQSAPKPECTVDADCSLPSHPGADDVAQCNNTTGKCVTVDVGNITCGGGGKNPHACPTGFRCTGSSSSTGSCVETCQYNGAPHDVGSTFSAVDGCNTCTCSAGSNGSVSVTCTERACVCDPSNEPNRRYIGTPSTCPVIRFACNGNEHSFFNSCGCGCQKN